MVEVAKKGYLARVVLTLVLLILIAAVGFLATCIWDGYFLHGTYGALVVPALIAGLWALWEVRRLFRHTYAKTPLIFFADGCLHYVAPGHSSIRVTDDVLYSIQDGTLPTLHFYDATTHAELKKFPLYLAATSTDEVKQTLSMLGLRWCEVVEAR